MRNHIGISPPGIEGDLRLSLYPGSLEASGFCTDDIKRIAGYDPRISDRTTQPLSEIEVNSRVRFECIEIIYTHNPAQVRQNAGVSEEIADSNLDAVRKRYG